MATSARTLDRRCRALAPGIRARGPACAVVVHGMSDQHAEAAPEAWVASSYGEFVGRAKQWLMSPTLGRLLSVLGGPTVEGTAASHAALRAWTAQVLDTRRGVERRDAVLAAWPDDTRRQV